MDDEKSNAETVFEYLLYRYVHVSEQWAYRKPRHNCTLASRMRSLLCLVQRQEAVPAGAMSRTVPAGKAPTLNKVLWRTQCSSSSSLSIWLAGPSSWLL